MSIDRPLAQIFCLNCRRNEAWQLSEWPISAERARDEMPRTCWNCNMPHDTRIPPGRMKWTLDFGESRWLDTFRFTARTVSEANSHTHWRERQRRAKAQRGAAACYMWIFAPELRDHFTRNPETAQPLRVTLTRIAPRALDSDNLAGSQKHVRDGIADGLGIDDRDPRVEWAYAQRRGASREYAVEVRIEPRPPLEADATGNPARSGHGAAPCVNVISGQSEPPDAKETG